MNDVLNPALFAILQRRLGKGHVAKRGEQRIAHYVPDPQHAGRIREKVTKWGEQYNFDCPFCGDTRGRLFVSYKYGLPDANGRPNYTLFSCKNDTQCHTLTGVRDRFEAMAAIPVGYRAQVQAGIAAAHASVETPVPTAERTFALPDHTTPLSDLPNDHPAITYLRGRGFSPEYLATTWDVRYASPWSSAASNRILIPVYRPELHFGGEHAAAGEPVLAGWQARFIGEPDRHTPKYRFPSGMPKSTLLYGLVQAKQTTGPIAICEGTTDVWRCGPGHAVATFGKAVSHDQKLLLVHHFAGRPLVVMLDADAADSAHELARELRLMRARQAGDKCVVVAQLPAGRKDPGGCTYEELYAAVTSALNQGGQLV